MLHLVSMDYNLLGPIDALTSIMVNVCQRLFHDSHEDEV